MSKKELIVISLLLVFGIIVYIILDRYLTKKELEAHVPRVSNTGTFDNSESVVIVDSTQTGVRISALLSAKFSAAALQVASNYLDNIKPKFNTIMAKTAELAYAKPNFQSPTIGVKCIGDQIPRLIQLMPYFTGTPYSCVINEKWGWVDVASNVTAMQSRRQIVYDKIIDIPNIIENPAKNTNLVQSIILG